MTGNEKWMLSAIKEAEISVEKDEIPTGCVIVFENRIIARAHNRVNSLKDPTAHAEILAITSAAEYLGSKALLNCSMYVTLEPCPMCAGAIVLAKIKNLFFGVFDLKSGACGSVINITNNKNLNHRCNIYGGILNNECKKLLQDFFKRKRRK